ncbi:MAG: hypothetical protein WAU70_13295 [Flavobacteriales bacterium]
MAIADFHCHVSFKPTLALRENRPDCWTNITSPILGSIVNSQSNLTQLGQGNVNLAFATLYGLEPGVAKQFLLHVVDPIVPVLDRRQLVKLRDARITSNESTREEIAAIEAHAAEVGKPKKVKLIRSSADYDPNDAGTIHLALNMEGGHNLYGAGNNGRNEKMVEENLLWFKKPDSPRLFYLGLAHLEQNRLTTHASGIKIFGKRAFLPDGAGLRFLGKRVAELAMADTGRKIFIDTRHMSLESRKDFYDWKRASAFKNEPIVCSHAGVTGASWSAPMPITRAKSQKQWMVWKLEYAARPSALVPGTNYNPCSINLYDEDIVEVAKSDGIIGVSFDIRILGGKVHGLREFVSVGEKDQFQVTVPVEKVSPGKLLDEDDERDEADEPAEQYTVNEKSKEFGMKHLVNNMLHIAKVCTTAGIADPWGHLALGSDYDGLIAPIGGFEHAGKLGSLAGDLETALAQFAPGAGVNIPDVKAVVKKVMHDNALRFLNTYFS